uniref:SSD domain-containing protein n=1 Tax=Macrostomum lignano TaxID=282301 RepID=A0A1I8FCA4_9PLAT
RVPSWQHRVHQMSFTKLAICSYCSFVVYSTDFNNILYGSLLTVSLANWFCRDWRSRPAKPKSRCGRACAVSLGACLFYSLLAFSLLNNARVTYEGESVPLREAVRNFFKSPLWREMRDTVGKLYEYYKIHGFKEILKQLWDALDPQGLKDAASIIGIKEGAGPDADSVPCRTKLKWRAAPGPKQDPDPDKKRNFQPSSRMSAPPATSCWSVMRSSLIGLLRGLRPPAAQTRTPARTIFMMGPYDRAHSGGRGTRRESPRQAGVPEEAKLSFRQRMAEWRARHHPEPPPPATSACRQAPAGARAPGPQSAAARRPRRGGARLGVGAAGPSTPCLPPGTTPSWSTCSDGCFFYPVVPLRAHFADPDLPAEFVHCPWQRNDAETCSEGPKTRALAGAAGFRQSAALVKQQQLKWAVLLTVTDEHLCSRCGSASTAHMAGHRQSPAAAAWAEARVPPPLSCSPIPPAGTGLARATRWCSSCSPRLLMDQQENQQLPETDWLKARLQAPLSLRRHRGRRLTPGGLCFFQAATGTASGGADRPTASADDDGAEPVFRVPLAAPYRPKIQQVRLFPTFNLQCTRSWAAAGRSPSIPWRVPAEGYQPSWLKEREASEDSAPKGRCAKPRLDKILL